MRVVGEGDDGIGVGMIDKSRGQNSVEDGLDAGRRGAVAGADFLFIGWHVDPCHAGGLGGAQTVVAVFEDEA